MNCPNCKKLAQSKIIDGQEYINCEACGFFVIEKDGSAKPLTESPAGWSSTTNDGRASALDTDAKPTPSLGDSQIDGASEENGETKSPIVADAQPPQTVELLDDEEAGDTIDINLHIETEDE